MTISKVNKMIEFKKYYQTLLYGAETGSDPARTTDTILTTNEPCLDYLKLATLLMSDDTPKFSSVSSQVHPKRTGQ